MMPIRLPNIIGSVQQFISANLAEFFGKILESLKSDLTNNSSTPVRVGAAAATVLALALFAGVIWSAVSAGLGLIALMAVGVVGYGFIRAIPYFAQKMENKILALRKSEARANPIEQLQNFLQQKHRAVNSFRQAVVAIGAQITSLSDMLEDRKKKYPNSDTSKQERSLLAMRNAHAQLTQKYERAYAATKDLELVIEEKKFEWQFGNAGKAAIQSLNATSGQDLLNEMLADEAFSSVRDNFNQVFAELDVEAARIHSGKSLEFDNGMSIDLSAIQIPEYQTLKKA